MRTPISVQFDDNAVISVSAALDYADHTNSAPRKVIWDDGFKSPCKAWWWSDSGKIDRIGAGAYGDFIVARRK